MVPPASCQTLVHAMTSSIQGRSGAARLPAGEASSVRRAAGRACRSARRAGASMMTSPMLSRRMASSRRTCRQWLGAEPRVGDATPLVVGGVGLLLDQHGPTDLVDAPLEQGAAVVPAIDAARRTDERRPEVFPAL